MLNLKTLRRTPAPEIPRIKPPAVAVMTLLDRMCPHGLAPILVPTDRMLERWAVTQGSDEWLLSLSDAALKSRPPPLPDDLAIVIDQCILQSHVQARNFVTRWYMHPGESITVLAKALGLHRDSVIMRWRSTLWYMRSRLQAVSVDV